MCACAGQPAGHDSGGVIADWTPRYFDPTTVRVPPFVPDNELVRRDVAAFYTSYTRLDAGIGAVLEEVRRDIARVQ